MFLDVWVKFSEECSVVLIDDNAKVLKEKGGNGWELPIIFQNLCLTMDAGLS